MKLLAQVVNTDSVVQGLARGPVHRLENVDGNPHSFRTACGKYHWGSAAPNLIDDSQRTQAVTCPECLMAMVDEPTIVRMG